MAINLQKGQKIELQLTKLTIGLGWDPNEGTGHDFDLDASAFMLNASKKLPSERHFIFYNNLSGYNDSDSNPSTSGEAYGAFGLKHTGDDPDGSSSDGDDDEAIMVNLEQVADDINEIVFVVTIEDYEARKQNFGQVRNSYIRIVDDVKNEEIAKYELDEDFSIETAVEFGRLYRRNGQWKFEASGIGHKEDLAYFVNKYYTGQVIK